VTGRKDLGRPHVTAKIDAISWGSFVATTGVYTQLLPHLAVCSMYGTPVHLVAYARQANLEVRPLGSIFHRNDIYSDRGFRGFTKSFQALQGKVLDYIAIFFQGLSN
jgi:hypothetical protein